MGLINLRHLARGLGLTLIVLALLMVGGCITPPAIPPAGWEDLDLLDYPPGSERVELQVDDGRTLVGVFVPAGEGAPVVVILPGALESVTLGARHDVRVSAGPAQAPTPDGLTSTTEEGPARTLTAVASLGWPEVPMFGRAEITSLASDLAEELWGRELTLTWRLMDSLRGQGLATLFVDYGGVGASSGDRDADCLEDDAWAIWQEALFRAGGDPSRVALRGTSLGTVAVAALLERGANPAAVVLVAPVRGETVVGHFARWTHVPWWQLLALPAMGSVTDADLVGAVDEFSGQLHIFFPEQDALLPEEERALLSAMVERPGAMATEYEQGHETLAIAGHDLLPGELETYGQAFGLLHQSQPRAAVVLAVKEAIVPALAPWMSRLPGHRVADLDQACARSLLDLDDPDGPFVPQCMAALATLLAGSGGDALAESPAALSERLQAMAEVKAEVFFGLDTGFRGMLDDSALFTVRFRQHGARIDDPVELALFMVNQRLRAETLDAIDPLSSEIAHRRALRRLLKGLGVPDKLTADGSLLAYSNGSWDALGD